MNSNPDDCLHKPRPWEGEAAAIDAVSELVRIYPRTRVAPIEGEDIERLERLYLLHGRAREIRERIEGIRRGRFA